CAAMQFNAVVATNKSAVRLYETVGIMRLDL
ncbi:MAG: GNAT family N-acetyltransferase, partial [Dermatophilaceae bacterium]|nr:GNAT family N-acetyltransferase [Dermatophilaceae bacterium]